MTEGMLGERQKRTASALAAKLHERLVGCSVGAEGAGVHWRVTVSRAERAASVHCFWYDAPAPNDLSLGVASSNAHLGSVDTGRQRDQYHGAEYLVVFRDAGARAAGGRTRDDEAVAGCLSDWLIARRPIDAIHEPWSFVDAKRRAMRAIAALVEAADASVRVVIEHDVGYELWAYGEDRSCRIDPQDSASASCAFLVGHSQVATATLATAALGEAVAAWTTQRISLAELARRVPRLLVAPHGELLERGETARWHWANVLDGARAGGPPLGPLQPLLERIVDRPSIARFFSFTSLVRLCFSRSSNFPFVTEGLPLVYPAGGEAFTVEHGDRRWTGDAAATADLLDSILSAVPDEPFRGSEADVHLPVVEAELTRQGSALRARRVQRRQWFVVRIVADDRHCDVTPGDRWSVAFGQAGSIRGHSGYPSGSAAISEVRGWLEERREVAFAPPQFAFDPD